MPLWGCHSLHQKQAPSFTPKWGARWEGVNLGSCWNVLTPQTQRGWARGEKGPKGIQSFHPSCRGGQVPKSPPVASEEGSVGEGPRRGWAGAVQRPECPKPTPGRPAGWPGGPGFRCDPWPPSPPPPCRSPAALPPHSCKIQDCFRERKGQPPTDICRPELSIAPGFLVVPTYCFWKPDCPFW